MRRTYTLLMLVATFAVLGSVPAANAGNVASGNALFRNTLAQGGFDCDRSGCHINASLSNNVNRILNGTSPSAILDMFATNPEMNPALSFNNRMITSAEAEDISCYISSWFPGPLPAFCQAATAVPVCTVSVSDPSPAVGSNVTLAASCTNAPTSYAWTNCDSTTSTCTTTSATAGVRTYTVTATNAVGMSPAVSVSVNWQAAGGGLQLPSPVNFGTQNVGATTTPLTATITNSGSTAVTITDVTSDNAAEFPIRANGCVGTVNPGASCQITFAFRPASTGTRSANISVFTSGTATPQQFLVFGTGQAATGVSNYTGLWWNSPAGSEDGWGLNVSHQGDTMFVTWFTYDATRKGWWLVMVASKVGEGVYKGDLLETRGPAFNTVPFNPSGAAVTNRKVGSATLDFASTEGPKFEVEIGTQPKVTKRITRQLLGTAPSAVCTFGTGNAAAATNYQDLWWAAPARSEDGWGVNLTHQGDTIFATWFTYDTDGAPMWLVVTAQKTTNGVYSGRLYRTTGTPYNATSYAGFGFTDVGSATFTFANGNSATFAYTVNGISQTKSIIRQILVSPGTVCQ